MRRGWLTPAPDTAERSSPVLAAAALAQRRGEVFGESATRLASGTAACRAASLPAPPVTTAVKGDMGTDVEGCGGPAVGREALVVGKHVALELSPTPADHSTLRPLPTTPGPLLDAHLQTLVDRGGAGMGVCRGVGTTLLAAACGAAASTDASGAVRADLLPP